MSVIPPEVIHAQTRASFMRGAAAMLVGVLVGFVLWNRPEPSEPTAPEPDYYTESQQWHDALSDSGLWQKPDALQEKLLENRIVIISSDINSVSANAAIGQMLLLDAHAPGEPIDLYIRTEGGWISDAFAIINIMRAIESPVNTYAIGGTHSAGAMLLAAGTGKRYVTEYGTIMFHAGRTEEPEPYSEDFTDNERMKGFWSTHADLPAKWLEQFEDEMFFFNAKQALEYKIADEILR